MSGLLQDYPDVLTDADLIVILRLSRRTFSRLVTRAKRTGVATLPPTLPTGHQRRYLRRDVERWLEYGGAVGRLRKVG